jgi:hypothetical protein
VPPLFTAGTACHSAIRSTGGQVRGTYEEMNMRSIRYNFLFAIGLMLTLGISAAMADNTDDRKRPKNMGTLSVRTTEESYPVKVDGQYIGMSGVGTGAEFYLEPGIHTVEVIGPDGKTWIDEVTIRRHQKHCICLKLIRETITTPCPYRFHLEGPERISEGDLVTFAAINSGTTPIPVRYAWRVTPDAVRVTSGLGTSSITIDSTGMGGQTINAELDVNDDVYDDKCRQLISVPTFVERLPPPEEPKPFRCDEFASRSADEDKARFDNCVIQALNTPDAQLYVIIYPGTDRLSRTRNTYDRLSKRALDYMVKERGFDPRRISIVRGGERESTTYELWIVPPGAQPPVVQ